MDVEVKKNSKNAQLKDHEVKELIKKSQEGDQQARDLLIEKNMRLVCVRRSKVFKQRL